MDTATALFTPSAAHQQSASTIATAFSEWLALGIAADDAAQLNDADAALAAIRKQRNAVIKIATARANAVCEMLPKVVLLKIAIDGDDGALIGALSLSLAFDIAALS